MEKNTRTHCNNNSKDFFLTSSVKNFFSYRLNFGPQHPAAHGVLRLLLEVEGELIINADPQIGFLHRGTEKLMEYKHLFQVLPYFDRLDYVSMMAQEHCFSMAVEKNFIITIPRRAQFIRVIFCEITRLLNHIMGITTHALDVGALTPFLWGFEEREKLLNFYEQVSGARMHAAYVRPGGVAFDIPKKFLDELFSFCTKFSARLNEIDELLLVNRVWKQRLVRVGSVSAIQALRRSMSGVMLRSTGIFWDLRVEQPYEIYEEVSDFRSFITSNGDCFDRYLLRMAEMRQSIEILLWCLERIPQGPVKVVDGRIILQNRLQIRQSMETLISHFKTHSGGNVVLNKEVSSFVEAPKGEFGFFFSSKEYSGEFERCKIHSPGFMHLQATNYMVQQHLLADVTAVIGTQDIVFGEVDR